MTHLPCNKPIFQLTVMVILISSAIPVFAESLWIITSDNRHIHYNVELADDFRERSRGLMFRKEMPVDEGMIFDFGYPQWSSMWMKNTLISLDMLFILPWGEISSISENLKPMNTEQIRSLEPVQAVLELRAGQVGRYQMQAGDRVIHPVFNQKMEPKTASEEHLTLP